MNRRSFLQGAALMFAAQAADTVIPFGRVWSFPKKIIVPHYSVKRFIWIPERNFAAAIRIPVETLTAPLNPRIVFDKATYEFAADIRALTQRPKPISAITV